MNDFERLLDNNCDKMWMLVGSRAYDQVYPCFNTSNLLSDYDYIVHMENIDVIMDRISLLDIKVTRSSYNGGLKFNYKGLDINLIPMNFIEFKAWASATEILKDLAKKDNFFREALQKKYCRYALLETYRAAYKSGLSMGAENV